VHLATPVGLLLFTGFSLNPLLWGAFLLIVLVHELGHARIVRACGLRVTSIDVTGLGGVCRYSGGPGDVQQSLIAWGGVLGQAVLLGVTELLVRSGMLPLGTPPGDVARAVSVINVALAGVNLLPLPGLDGWKAWPLFRWRNLRQLGRRSRKATLARRARAIEEELRGIEEGASAPPRKASRKDLN
jgi:Zn-dependent protease